MNIIEVLLISISLAMDAFTISICKGIKSNKISDGIIITLFFSFFQFIMPIIGFYLGNIFSNKILNYHSYFSPIILISIGLLMLKEDKIDDVNSELNYKELIILSIATSIDALVVGISFSFNNSHIFISSIIIGLVTFIICNMGYYLGSLLHKKIHQYANIIGGITLIIIGIKILFTQL